jgi:hypothetical protein
MKIFHFPQKKQEIKELKELKEITDYLTDNFGKEGVRWWTHYNISTDRENQISAKFYIDIPPEEESKLTYFLLKYI